MCNNNVYYSNKYNILLMSNVCVILRVNIFSIILWYTCNANDILFYSLND